MRGADAVLIHYGELGLKGRDRPFFERKLRVHIDRALAGLAVERVRWETGRMTLLLEGADPRPVMETLGKVPGIQWFALVRRLAADMETFKRALVEAAAGDRGSFRVEVKRSNKRFPVTSMEIARQMGAAVVEASGRKVDLHQPDHTYRLEIAEKGGYLHTARLPGLGGLPARSGGVVGALVSGGVDSALAALRLIVRGATVELVHFEEPLDEASGQEERGEPDRIERLAAVLSTYQGDLVLHRIEVAVGAGTPGRLRWLVERRLMLRVAGGLLAARGGEALVTGDVIGQTAGQTLENLSVVLAAAPAPVLTPLAGARGVELVEAARAFGLEEIARGPGVDRALSPSPSPAPRAARAEVEAAETFDVEAAIREALDRTVTTTFSFGARAGERDG